MAQKGYESIPSNNSEDNERRAARGGFFKLVWIILAIVAAAVVYVVLKYPEHHQEVVVIEDSVADEDDSVEDTIVSTRPVCEVHTPDVKVKVLQTSMRTPSQTWAPIPCRESSMSSVELNAYKYPDAILQTNLSSIVFPHSRIKGFGGAFTEAAALNFHQLSEIGKTTLLELLYGKSGLGYTLGRFPLNSCDFSVKSYSFDDTVDDFTLEDFDTGVYHDAESGMIDMGLRAVSTLRHGWGGDETNEEEGEMFLYASPWSPPAWMKTPTYHWKDHRNYSSMTGSAQPNCLKEGVGPDSRYAKSWALYFSKFLTAYRNLGLPLQAVTVQNEPEFPAPWEACAYDPASQRDFVANHLGPQLETDHPDVKILMFDHNKDHINHWAEILLNQSSSSRSYIAGTAYHWYAGGMDRLLDGALGIANLHRFQAQLQNYSLIDDHILFGSEACHCPTTGYAGGDIDVYWSRAERYAHTILADLAAGSQGWVEWNLVLDGIGGPNHLGNLCETTILAVPHRAKGVSPDYPRLPPFESQLPFGNNSVGDGRTREELNAKGFPAKYLDVGLAVQPLYYYMGHISRHVRPGSFAVPALVESSFGNSSRIFRPESSVVAGGGQNDLAREGIEVSVWPCEGSTRQQFKWSMDSSKRIMVLGHDWLGFPTTSCIARTPNVDFKGLLTVSCTSHEAGSFDVLPLADDPEGSYVIKLMNPVKNETKKQEKSTKQEEEHGHCLTILELQNGGGAYGPRGGAQVTLGDCDREAAKWKLDPETGEASSTYFDDGLVCLTTGWPFLQVGAFQKPSGGNTVVVLNEANDPANFALRDGEKVLVTSSIPARSIQTILID